MPPFATLFQDNIKRLFHSVAPQVLDTSIETPSPASQTGIMTQLWLPDYIEAVTRCRRHHKFFFLDLPKPIRYAIYAELFSSSTIQVCSWLKEHEGAFAEAERCQILLTCRTISMEATGYLYYYTRWKFASQSSLLYFTWPDVDPLRWRNVTTITLTRLDILPDFVKHLPKFERLRTLTIDQPAQFRINALHRPRKGNQRRFVRNLLNTSRYLHLIHPYVYIMRSWEFCLTVHVVHNRHNEEIVLVNMDRQEIRCNYYPVPVEVIGPMVTLPSADDDDAEVWVAGESQGWDYEWT